MDIFSYTGKVKTFKDSEILSVLLAVEVAANDLYGSLELIKNNNIDLTKQIDSWVLAKTIKKLLDTRGKREDGITENMLFGITVVKALVPDLIKLVKGYNEKLWDGNTLTVKQANILNLIEYLGFWLRYTRTIFDVLVTMNNEGVDPQKYLNGVDYRWLMGTELFFKQFTGDLMMGARHIVQDLNKIPDVEISKSSLEVLEATEDEATTDLLKKGFGIHLVNPIFWISLGVARIQMRRIEQMRKNNETFAMKVSQAINKRNGTPDPQLDRQIEIYQEEIIKNEHAISEIEKDYA
jgi:hypothetical protein